MRIACWILKATNALRICNIHCPSTATVVTVKQLNFKLHKQYTACLFLISFVSYHLLRTTFMNHLLNFSGIRRHVNFFKYLYFARYKFTGFFEVRNLEA